MKSRLIRFAVVFVALALLVGAAGWAVTTLPGVREPLVEAVNTAGEAYIRFVFRLYRLAAGGADGPPD